LFHGCRVRIDTQSHLLTRRKYHNDLNVKYRNNHLLTKSHLFRDSGAFLSSKIEKNISTLCVLVWEKIAVKNLIWYCCFGAYKEHIYPTLLDNVIRDEVLYVSYQFSLEPLLPGAYLKSLSSRKLNWKMKTKIIQNFNQNFHPNKWR
jgi:hypothetical protein